jgi:hypothetical protein
MKRCHKCGTPWISETKTPGVKECCETCSAYLHCCLNCRYYEPTAHNQCYIPTTDWVADKEGANFCDEFVFRDTEEVEDTTAEQDAARSALDGLFGGQNGAQKKGLEDFQRLFGE